jgi:hypothetical protein
VVFWTRTRVQVLPFAFFLNDVADGRLELPRFRAHLIPFEGVHLPPESGPADHRKLLLDSVLVVLLNRQAGGCSSRNCRHRT